MKLTHHIVTLAAATFALASPVSAFAAAAPAPSMEAGTLIPGITTPVSDQAIWVAPGGSDTGGNGSLAQPYRTLARGIASATATRNEVVLQAGTYHESIIVTKRVTVRSAPGAQVWMSGTSTMPASAWTRDAATGHSVATWSWTPYRVTPPPGTQDPAAGLPEQLFADGRPIRQVVNAASMTPDSFYYDATHGRVVLGSAINPATTRIELSDLQGGLTLQRGSEGSRILGIGFAGYASVWGHGRLSAALLLNMNSDSTGQIEIAGSAFRHNGFAGVGANNVPGLHVHDSTFVGNGNVGMRASTADGLVLEDSYFADNNLHYITSAGTHVSAWGTNHEIQHAGAKIGRSANVIVRRSVFANNLANGLWFDVGVSDTHVYGNRFEGNRTHGAFYEVSTRGYLFSNVSVDNGEMGFKTTSTHVLMSNNTSLRNGVGIGVVEDRRSAVNGDCVAVTIDPEATCDTADVRLRNNVVSETPGRFALLRVDGTSTAMLSESDANLYHRATAGVPAAVVAWGTGGVKFPTVAAFRAATGFESAFGADNDLVGDNALLLDSAQRPGAESPLITHARPVPAEVRNDYLTLTGDRTVPAAVDLGAVRWPETAEFPVVMTRRSTTPPVDTTAPTVTLASPAVDDVVSGMIQPVFNATDDRSVARVELRIDGVLVDADNAAPWMLSADTATQEDGAHRVSVRAIDAAGNVGLGFARVTIANAPPRPIVSAVGESRRVTATWDAVEAADLAGYEVRFNASGATTWIAAAAPRRATFVAPDHTVVSVQVRSVDAAGNRSAWSTATAMTSENTAPTCAASSATVPSGGTGWIKLNCTDEEGDSVTARINDIAPSTGLSAGATAVDGGAIALGVSAAAGSLGTYAVRISVTDNAGAETQIDTTATAERAKATASITANCETPDTRVCTIMSGAKSSMLIELDANTDGGTLGMRVLTQRRVGTRWVTIARSISPMAMPHDRLTLSIADLTPGTYRIRVRRHSRQRWIRVAGDTIIAEVLDRPASSAAHMQSVERDPR